MPANKLFRDWMEERLYSPEGYYSSGSARTGRRGDYFTAPETGPAFAWLLARLFRPWLHRLDARTVVDVGAGEGALLSGLAHELRDDAVRFIAVERSPARRRRLESAAPAALRFADLSELFEKPVEGIFIANELIDAFPVHRVRVRDGQLEELSGQPEAFRWSPTSTPRLAAYFKRLRLELPEGYQTEVNLDMAEWLHQASRALHRGLLIIIDYGRPAWDYYAPERDGGTLRGFRDHRVVRSAECGVRSDERPTLDPDTVCSDTTGASQFRTPHSAFRTSMDLTADVDFTSLALDAREAGFEVLAFQEMGAFLQQAMRGDAPDVRQTGGEHSGIDWSLRVGLKYLLHPDGLGSQFHVLVLGKDVDPTEWAFEFNRIGRLRL